MPKHEIIKIFGERKVRSVWDDVAEKWYFSVVDVVAVLTDSADPRNYWKVLKNRLKKEGNETVTNCNQLKLRAEDGKMRLTDVSDQEQLFRLIQSIPSPKAEPFKVWMAKIASAATLPRNMMEHHRVAASGGGVAKNARLELERKTGRKVVSPLNASDTGALEVNLGDVPPLPSP